MSDYIELMKPRIIFGNVLTAFAGFFIGSKNGFDLTLFALTMIGLAMVIASASIFNNYIDRNLDRKMDRTKARSFAKGTLPVCKTLVFSSLLGCLGCFILFWGISLKVAILGMLGFFVYVCLYTPMKTRSSYATAIGTISGAIPAALGYTAASGHFDLGAILLFMMMVIWQMPHFLAIALWHIEDYSKGNVLVLPVVKGAFYTKVSAICYVILFILPCFLLKYFGYVGWPFFLVSLVLFVGWIRLAATGFKPVNDRIWAKQMFRYSLVVITLLCLTTPFEKLYYIT